MKDSLKIALGIFIGAAAVVLCALCLVLAVSAGGLALLVSAPTSTAISSVGEIPAQTPQDVNPTSPPQDIGASIVTNELRVTMTAYEFSDAYEASFGMQESPPQGAKFLWIHIAVENVGQTAAYAPSISEFSVLYQGEQTDADFYFVDRPDYPPYDPGEIFPGVIRQGWLRFTIPVAASPEQLSVVYKPFDVFSDTYYTWMLGH